MFKKTILTVLVILIMGFPLMVQAETFKPYMDYRTITDTTSKQYALQQKAYTNQKNGIRMINGYFCVAIGQGWNIPLGHTIEVTLSTGDKIYCVISDVKQNIHTDNTNKYDLNGGMLEFIVDTDVLPLKAKKLGDISILGFWGHVIGAIR